MQLEALWGNRAFFLKMQLQGKSWDNLGELGKAAEICGDLRARVRRSGAGLLLLRARRGDAASDGARQLRSGRAWTYRANTLRPD